MGNGVYNTQLDDVNIDEVNLNGFYAIVGASAGTLPFTSDNVFGLLVSGNNNPSYLYTIQIVVRFSSADMKVRSCQGGNWKPWKTIVDN